MDELTFNNLIIRKEEKTFEILKGSIGVYSYLKLKKAKIVSEDSKFTGKSDIFSHQVVVSRILQSSPLFTKNVYIGIEMLMNDDQVLYVYVSDKANQSNSLLWHEDLKKADEIMKILNKIITKNNQ